MTATNIVEHPIASASLPSVYAKLADEDFDEIAANARLLIHRRLAQQQQIFVPPVSGFYFPSDSILQKSVSPLPVSFEQKDLTWEVFYRIKAEFSAVPICCVCGSGYREENISNERQHPEGYTFTCSKCHAQRRESRKELPSMTRGDVPPQAQRVELVSRYPTKEELWQFYAFAFPPQSAQRYIRSTDFGLDCWERPFWDINRTWTQPDNEYIPHPWRAPRGITLPPALFEKVTFGSRHTPEMRRALELVFVFGWKQEDAATRHNVNPASLKKAVTRVIAQADEVDPDAVGAARRELEENRPSFSEWYRVGAGDLTGDFCTR